MSFIFQSGFEAKIQLNEEGWTCFPPFSDDARRAVDVTQVKLLLMRMRLAFGKLIVCPPPLR